MRNLAELRAGVRKSLPELEQIGDPELREKVVDAWALALSESEFERIEDMRASGGPDTPLMRRGTQADHQRGVARMALAMADELERLLGPLGLNRDVILAAGLCHDLGKPYEFGPANQERWKANRAVAGYPAMRHPAYGAHLALKVGMPEPVVHAIGAHSREGEHLVRSPEAALIHHADHLFWLTLKGTGMLEGEGPI